jgi:ABC-type tungstate transport system substrate-binding protein
MPKVAVGLGGAVAAAVSVAVSSVGVAVSVGTAVQAEAIKANTIMKEATRKKAFSTDTC